MLTRWLEQNHRESHLPEAFDQHREQSDGPELKQYTTGEQHPKHLAVRAHRWDPIWLHGFILPLMAGLFLLLALSLILLWHFNVRANGFKLITNNHYAWTYGPTALLIFVVPIWRQVDYHYKAALPWQLLQCRFTSAEYSILLDYVSPLQIVSFWASLRNSHFIVATTIVVFVILKLVTVASTGLLTEQSVGLPVQNMRLALTTSLNGSLYNVSAPVATTDAPIAYTAYGILAHGLADIPGTTPDMAYETVRLRSDALTIDGSIQVQVKALFPNFNCQPAEVSINPSPYDANGQQVSDTMSILSPSCHMMGGAQPTFVNDLNRLTAPLTQFRGAVQRVNCSDRDVPSEELVNWQLLTIAEVEYSILPPEANQTNSTANDTVSALPYWRIGVKQATSVLCRPSYGIGTAALKYDFSYEPPLLSAAIDQNTAGNLVGFRDNDLGASFTAALAAGSNMFGDLSENLAVDFPNTMFKLMAAGHGDRYENLMDQDVMMSTAERTFKHLAVQIARKNIFQEDNSDIVGISERSEKRLVISEFSLWVMVAGFILVAVLSFAANWMRLNKPIPYGYENIYGLALLLAQNHGFQKVMDQVIGYDDATVRRILANHQFLASWSEDCKQLDLLNQAKSRLEDQTDSHNAGTGSAPKELWWNPLTLKRWILVMTLCLPIAGIVTLEVLQRLSDRSHGLGDVSDMNGASSIIYTRLLPAFVVLVIASLVNAVEFNIFVLSPFDRLWSRDTKCRQSLQSSLINLLPPLAFWKALRHRHYAALCSSIATVLGASLTIIVSGLYTVEQISYSTEVVLFVNQSMNLNWANSSTQDNGAAALISLTESLNLSYPAFTVDELAFPYFDQLGSLDAIAAESTLQTRLPAFRASLNCSILNPSKFNVSAVYNSRINSASANVDARLPLPNSCLRGGPGGNLSYIEITYRVGFAANASYIGKILDLHVGPYDPILGSAFGESDPRSNNDNPPECPSLAFIYGYIDLDDQTQNSVTTMMCYQEMQRLQVNVNFDVPSMSISTTFPPATDEGTVEILLNGPNRSTAWQYRIQQHMDQSLSLFNQTKYASSNLADSPIDPFFQAVLVGKKPIAESLLSSKENASAVYDGILAFYRRYMAQAISNNMRGGTADGVPATGVAADKPQSFPGTVLNAIRKPRVVQQNQAKVALQVLFGLISVLLAIAYKLARLRRLVPYNPCTIFGVASLLVGTNMCSEDERERLQSAPSDRKYRLDWWYDNSRQWHEGDLDCHDTKRRRRYRIDVVDDHH
ncbi:uncharacterized protein A1O9_09553 [Exophiala aquamarina CBS 119918]|uniref:Uncharacterized protein n=1 Tax=Exophiala aquamarina CBS 119918 TaxID=1182545 RepID=A0A072P3V4_9EURO|nr:uncharacterized protein A1O9_09553 [Exophiala aquamarina CBS 119918]KEF54387.1 hypothetical protein A1O9_09553 [Exophiala aquamarina CBS 119918]